ncbi:P-loop containing nucleoside triphosphate hydrolases superfamily protein [Prunus dulcis]|uniref:P-loop containing nucleoside triphosphate hydrolases superfamily protein n=1 Tax=Prunus dulcis TaxID=3755 RepID=A0A4Y1QTY4_PRUDU|nr:P-loop containing nucleoside triphosphate hydrolases superfamily protein [Prunus dulcis]
MVLLHLPRTHISLCTHFSLFSKPKTPTFNIATTLHPILTCKLFSAPKSTLSASEPIPISQFPETTSKLLKNSRPPSKSIQNSKLTSKSRSRSSSCLLKPRSSTPTPVL